MSDLADRQDPPWTGTVPQRVRSGNNKDKMNALEEAYNELKQQTPDVSGTRRVTKLDIIRAASINTASLEKQLREARASQPELNTTGLTGAQPAKPLPTQILCPMPTWTIPTKVHGKLWTPPEVGQPGQNWIWPQTLEWPVQVWEDPLPTAGPDRPAASATQTQPLTGGEKTKASRRGEIRVSPWLIQANPQAGQSQHHPMNGSSDQPFIVEDDPTRSDFKTWPTITLTEEQSPEGRTAQVREYVRIQHDVEYRDTQTGEEITEAKRLERLRKKYKERAPHLPGKKKKDGSAPKNTKKGSLPESAWLKGGTNCLPLSEQLQKVVNQMKVDEKAAGSSGISLSTQLQGVFTQMRAEEATNKENSFPRKSQQSRQDQDASKLPSQPEIDAQFQTALDLLSASQLQTAIDQLTSEAADKGGNPRGPSVVLPETQEAAEPMVPVITDQEYVESEDDKIGDGTGSDTTEELNFDDILDNVSEIPLEPLPGHEVLGQLPVDQDVLSQESSDDDYTDWPTIRPLRIDLGVPVRQEDYQPRGRG